MSFERESSADGAPVGGTTDTAVINIAAYRFVALDRLESRREELRSLCSALELRGTILLSREGINLFLSGDCRGITAFLRHLEHDPALAGMSVKRSVSPAHPFARLKVKLKTEIIPFGVEGVDPVRGAAPAVAPRHLRQWLSAGRDVTLLDVRNKYEVACGTFAGSRSLGIDHFRHLPAAVKRIDDELRGRPLVMFCTGGIRCEKAALYLQQQGFADVQQLEGGILQYFADCGGEHYEGNCFVFDERVAVDAHLRPVSLAAGAIRAEKPASRRPGG